MSDAQETINKLLKKLISAIPEVTDAAIVSNKGDSFSSVLSVDIDETPMAAMCAAILSVAERGFVVMNKGVFQELCIMGTEEYILVSKSGDNMILKVSKTPQT